MKARQIALVGVLGVAGVLVAACGPTADPIPQADPTKAPAPVVTTQAPKATTCDVVREALLTGSKAEIAAAMQALKVDKTMDGTAREYAGYWLGRDKTDPQFRQMDEELITTACSV